MGYEYSERVYGVTGMCVLPEITVRQLQVLFHLTKDKVTLD